MQVMLSSFLGIKEIIEEKLYEYNDGKKWTPGQGPQDYIKPCLVLKCIHCKFLVQMLDYPATHKGAHKRSKPKL